MVGTSSPGSQFPLSFLVTRRVPPAAAPWAELGRVVGAAEAPAEAEGTWQGQSCCPQGPSISSPAGCGPWARTSTGRTGRALLPQSPGPGSTLAAQPAVTASRGSVRAACG